MAERILIAESGSGYGGTAKYLASLLPLLDKNRFSVEIVSYGDGPFIQQVVKEGWKVHYRSNWRFPWGESIEESMAGKKQEGLAIYLKYLLAGTVQMFVMVPAIVRWLRKHQIQLVHLNNDLLSHLPLLLAARISGCKTLCHFHGWRSFTFTERLFASCADEFVTISEAGAAFFNQGRKSRKMIPIPNGLSVNGKLNDFVEKRVRQRKLLGIDGQTKVISIIGRLVPWKGQEIFIRALREVIQNNPDVVGVILGHDPFPNQAYLKKLQNVAKELGIESHIQFLPWQEDVWSIYAASDVVVHASTEPEPFGLVILEAMFAKKPVIATKGGGVSDLVIHEETGYLVKPGSSKELADALMCVVTDSLRAARLAEAGEKRAKTYFTMERNASKIQEVYEQLLSDWETKKHHGSQARRNLNLGLKQTVLNTGVVSLIRNSISFKVPILMYHRISTSDDPFFPAVSEKVFREQMAYVRRSYRVLSMDELVQYWQEGQKVPARSLAVTFDDGNAPTWSVACPILKEFEIPVTIFLATSPTEENSFIWTDLLRWWFKLTCAQHCSIHVNGRNSEWLLNSVEERLCALRELSLILKNLENDQRKMVLDQLERELGVKRSDLPDQWLLTWDRVRSMREGNVKFGAHTMTHPILSRMSAEEARYEIFESKRRLEEILNEKVKHFAYPNGEMGDFNRDHEELVARAGFDSASSTILGLNDHESNRYALRRIYAGEEPLASFASRLVGLGS